MLVLLSRYSGSCFLAIRLSFRLAYVAVLYTHNFACLRHFIIFLCVPCTYWPPPLYTATSFFIFISIYSDAPPAAHGKFTFVPFTILSFH